MICTIAAASSFLLGRAYYFLNTLPLLSLPGSYSDYVGVNILLNSSSLSFLTIYAPPIHSLMGSRTDSFSPSFSPLPEIFLLWKTSTTIALSGTPEVLLIPLGRKYSIGSSPQTSTLSIILTPKLLFITPLSVAPLLTSSLLPTLLLLGDASGLGF